MGRVLIVYFSLNGNTEKMAQYIAEGVRISGQQIIVKKRRILKALTTFRDTTVTSSGRRLITEIWPSQ